MTISVKTFRTDLRVQTASDSRAKYGAVAVA